MSAFTYILHLRRICIQYDFTSVFPTDVKSPSKTYAQTTHTAALLISRGPIPHCRYERWICM